MTEFEAHVSSWHDFFMLAGTASATMLGLLFVGVSVREDVRRQPPMSFLRVVIGQNFLCFLVVLLFSLYFLMPNPTRDSVAWPVIITSAVATFSSLRSSARIRAHLAYDGRLAFWHLLVPTLCFIASVSVGIALLIQDDVMVDWMVPVIALLLTIPTRNAWGMLLHHGPAQTG